ncbi:MAG TPA: M28 family peptidase, partial [Armatimonadota bacterium]|nr:M28 family peptidase [Armatimonadota bacterium]
MKHLRVLRLFFLASMLLALPCLLYAQSPAEKKLAPATEAAYRNLSSSVNPDNLNRHIRNLASLSSRVAGYPGADKAADYVESEFRKAGLTDVRSEKFPVTVPMDSSSSMQIGNAKYKLYPLWPNMVQTSRLPEGGLDAPIIDVGPGNLSNFKGKQVNGSVVLVDFNSAQEWLNAPRLGAKAVIFVEPESTQRGEAEGKFIGIPLAIPRFWISRQDADAIRSQYQLNSDGNYLVPKAHLTSDVSWVRRNSRNVVGWIEGSDPKFKNQVIVIESYYDSMSVVPDLAPGAEVAGGVATQLELARLYAGQKPRRSVMFLSTGAHHLALKGIRAYMEQHFNEYAQPPAGERFMQWAGNHSTPLGKVIISLIVLAILYRLLRNISKTRFIARTACVVVSAALLFGCVRFVTLSPKQETPRKQLYVFTSLDLSSKTPRVGLFYKGMYYDFRQDIQRKFADFARVQRENAESICNDILDAKPDARFADGVNPISGKDWRNFIPGKIALDNEPVTMAGAMGVGFATTDDARPYVDTPFDTPDKVSIYNLSQQARLLAALYYNMFNDNNDPQSKEELALPVTDPSTFSRMTLTGGFARLTGRMVEFNPKRSFIPDQPVPDGLAVVENSSKSFMGVRGPMIEQVDSNGRFDFAGVAPLTAYGSNRATYISAYHIDPKTGAIDYAPDLGITGAKDYPLEQYITTGEKQATIVVFKGVSTSLYDLVDPQMLRALTSLSVLDGQSNAEPRMYGNAVARPEPWISHVDDAAVIYSQP